MSRKQLTMPIQKTLESRAIGAVACRPLILMLALFAVGLLAWVLPQRGDWAAPLGPLAQADAHPDAQRLAGDCAA